MWKILQDFYKQDEFLDILKEVDDTSSNILQITACFSSKKILKFILKELEKIMSKIEIQNFLSILGISRKNLLQLALTQNKSASLHRCLWKIIKKFFNSDEILDIIKHKNVNGKKLLFHAFEYSTIEIIGVTWIEIWKIFIKVDEFALSGYLKSTNNEFENILHVLVNEKDSQNLKILWTILERACRLVTGSQLFRDLFFQKTLLRHDNVLHIAAKNNKLEFHDTFWELLLKSFKNHEELKNLMFQTNKFEDNFLTFLILCDNADIIEFTFKKINENFTHNNFQEILHHKGYKGRNLLQFAACTTKNLITFQTLWKIFQNSCKTSEEFLKVIKEVDDDNNNVIHYAACFSTKEIFNFIINKLQSFSSQDNIKELLSTSGKYDKNFLQLAARHNECIKFHQNLWEVIENFFKSSEIANMIRHNKECLMLDVVKCNTKEIVEFTWNKIHKALLHKNTHLDTKVYKGTDLLSAAKKNACNPDVHEHCKFIFQDYEDSFKRFSQ